jgi:hypothetical protein
MLNPFAGRDDVLIRVTLLRLAAQPEDSVLLLCRQDRAQAQTMKETRQWRLAVRIHRDVLRVRREHDAVSQPPNA